MDIITTTTTTIITIATITNKYRAIEHQKLKDIRNRKDQQPIFYFFG
jgi:hypothetical protein